MTIDDFDEGRKERGMRSSNGGLNEEKKVTFTTTIRKEWWKQKTNQYEQKGYFYEYKECKPFWNKRIKNLGLPADAVFLVDSVPHRATITEISCAEMHNLPMEAVAFFFFSETLNPKQTVKEFRNSKVWVLKCENVRGETEE